MTVKELIATNKFTALTLPLPNREIEGIYIGDLLSWVMGKAQADNAWITIMSNINVAAVASLTDVACVILAEAVTMEADVLKTAEEKEINIISSPLSAYDTAVLLTELLNE
ncbi:MAG: hypothetical protein E7561_00790 [Ruminococcaceae bacterium]|nr:hypothetical protein [Oscillospiraceae bacterium]